MHMIIVNRQGDVISGSVNGEQFGVSFDEKKFDEMLRIQTLSDQVTSMEELKALIEEFKPLTEESYKELVEHKTPYLFVNKSTNKYYLKYQDHVSRNPLPKVFVDKIITSVEKNIDIAPLIKCMARYMRPVKGRPAYSEQAATLFAQYIDADYVNQDIVATLMKDNGLASEVATAKGTTKQVAITKEGLLVCYKVSTEIMERFLLDEETEEVKTRSRYGKEIDPDTGEVTLNKPDFVEDRLFEPRIMGQGGDAFYCGSKLGHFIKVGEVHYLESWDQVSHPGCKGLHVGGLRYIQGYQNDRTTTHNVLVDPMHIHSIAGLGIGNDGAMTVKQYFVHSSFAGPNKNIYHSSTYAALTDKEFAELVEEAVKATEAKADELRDILNETKDLVDRPKASMIDVFGG